MEEGVREFQKVADALLIVILRSGIPMGEPRDHQPRKPTTSPELRTMVAEPTIYASSDSVARHP
jgi:hypothetical protein